MKFREKASLYKKAQVSLNKSLMTFMQIESSNSEEHQFLQKVISDLQKSQQNSIKARIRWTSES